MKTTHTFHISGIHCKACVLITEGELADMPNITHSKARLGSHTLQVTGDWGNDLPVDIAASITGVLRPHGYIVSVEKSTHEHKWSEFMFAVPITIIFASIFVLLQKAGLVNLVGGGDVTYGTSFVVGIIASLSSCMAVVGGLLLSMSATFAKSGDKIRPQLMFHCGRIVAFFVLGGVIGALGSAFALGAVGTFILSAGIALVMLILGINLLGVFAWAKRLQPSMPSFVSRRAHGVSKLGHTLTPILVGIATFFLPCGFTQSMQLYALTTGGFTTGALTMLAFALGTLPVLSIISFSSFAIQKKKNAGIFFKTAGLIVILFALFNLINSLVVIGVLSPAFNI